MRKNKNMSIWFTSDTHFGHANIIRFCDRPFGSIEEHDEVLIDNWNKCIKPGDDVYHMGDFSFDKRPDIVARRLNGRKHLIRGNHDHFKQSKLINPHFEWIKDYHSLKVDKQKFILFHYPIRNWHHCYKGTIHLFGHSHGGTPDMGKSTDAGVDCWDYSPVHIDTILSYMKGKEHITHHN